MQFVVLSTIRERSITWMFCSDSMLIISGFSQSKSFFDLFNFKIWFFKFTFIILMSFLKASYFQIINYFVPFLCLIQRSNDFWTDINKLNRVRFLYFFYSLCTVLQLTIFKPMAAVNNIWFDIAIRQQECFNYHFLIQILTNTLNGYCWFEFNSGDVFFSFKHLFSY